jgi:hypothetical protein
MNASRGMVAKDGATKKERRNNFFGSVQNYGSPFRLFEVLFADSTLRGYFKKEKS